MAHSHRNPARPARMLALAALLGASGCTVHAYSHPAPMGSPAADGTLTRGGEATVLLDVPRPTRVARAAPDPGSPARPAPAARLPDRADTGARVATTAAREADRRAAAKRALERGRALRQLEAERKKAQRELTALEHKLGATKTPKTKTKTKTRAESKTRKTAVSSTTKTPADGRKREVMQALAEQGQSVAPGRRPLSRRERIEGHVTELNAEARAKKAERTRRLLGMARASVR